MVRNRYIIIFLFSLLFIPIHVAFSMQTIRADDHETPFAVVIMLKNEAEVIIPTLQLFVQSGVDSFLIYDTGSTDRTQNIVQDYFTQNNLSHAYVIEEPFIGFATSRNRALDLA